MRLAARIDDNQPAVVKALREAGAKVRLTHQLGGGFPDLLVGWKGQLILVEVKDGCKDPCKQRLTKDEQEFFDAWAGYPVHMVRNEIEALALLGIEVVIEPPGIRSGHRGGGPQARDTIPSPRSASPVEVEF